METLLIVIFVVGYLAVVLEHNIHINKSAPALIIGILCWTVYILMTDKSASEVHHELHEYISEVASILFFLLGAMTIVELIDAHEGFDVITKRIKTNEKIKLLWIICLLTFFLSALLDNLTTTIVMISILRKLVKTRKNRLFFIGMVIIAANSGGAWSPIGDVTTTMLWIGGQISSHNIVFTLLLPSFVCLLVPLIISSFLIKGNFESPDGDQIDFRMSPVRFTKSHIIYVSKFEKRLVFCAGIGSLIFVPFFKSFTHLPPFMGMLFSLGCLWLLTEIMHKDKNDEVKDPISVIGVLKKVDVPSVLFFFGILIAISSLQATGILKNLAMMLDESIGNIYLIGLSLGVLSAIVDNVPLVAASMGMYDLKEFPLDHTLWEFIAYCAGTGGSALIVGSAAGVAAMGMERINFIWYLKNIAWLAMVGYFAGAGIYILQEILFS
ncbi:sodium:proton antiporter NhaD [Chondrinema litorale]|uniref:sodium:proton antiporter NhaD n=1 Tax=Chondrinema litorale TaxID=2994555 RepID=UPI002542FE0A|nr:sodium:proton antiporter NhaD [Chondrinema litorale]UZR92260.1 sodium:proton antiporter NhaD [Chondrinema litorale]